MKFKILSGLFVLVILIVLYALFSGGSSESEGNTEPTIEYVQ